MKKIISMVLVCVSLLTMLCTINPVTASAASTQSLDAVKNTQVTIKHVKSGLFINVPYGNYTKNPKIILWPNDFSREQDMVTKFYGDNSMRILFDENTKYCVDIYSPSRKLRAGLTVDSWKVSPSEDMYQLFVPYIVPGKDDVVIFRMKGNMNLALGAKKTTKNTVLELMSFKESDSRLYFQFCDTKYKTIDLAATTTTNATMKPMVNGISATVSSTAIKYSDSVTVKVNLDATALADQVTVKIGNVTKSVKPSVIANRIGQQASITFKGSELGSSTGHPVTVTATNKAGSASVSLAKVKVTTAFVSPLKAINGGKTNIVTQGFGSNAYNKNKDHLGVDYSGAASNVVAICDGKVVDIYKGNGYGYGETVILQHRINGKTVYSLYGHMKKNSTKLKIGDVVMAGQVLGRMGSTGTSTGDHTHVAIFTGTFKAGETVPAGYYSGNFSSSKSITVGKITYYSAVEFIKSAGSIITK